MNNSINRATSKGAESRKVEVQETAPQSTYAPSSEIGRLAASGAAVISDWSDKLQNNLEEWYEIATAIEEVLDQAKFVGSEIAYCARHAKTAHTANGNTITGYYIPIAHYNDMMEAMSDLGIPQSQIAKGTYQTSGKNAGKQYLSVQDFKDDLKLMVEYGKLGAKETQSQVSSLKNDQTKALFKVMTCYNFKNANINSLSSVIEALISISKSALNNLS